MAENNPIDIKSDLNAQDLAVIDTYRKKKDTSVLTIMFTDMKGFTSLAETLGDARSDEVRAIHDDIIVKTVEENDAGKVLKKIGDSIMAIFSEPSAAVEKAMRIQEKLREFNKQTPDSSKILVRIGLNMGQVTVENNVNMDVFGHVVNRAARIKEMADGDQVFLSYTVFDSAKGWILSRPGMKYGWVSHGHYFVKGVEEPLEVFEVFEKDAVKPKSPVKGKKISSFPKLLTSIALLAAGGLAVAFFHSYEATSVSFRYVNLNTKLYLDDRKEVTLDGEGGQELRPSLTKIPPGDHVVFYDVSYVVRYYAEFNVKRGKNIITPQFKYNGMPGLDRYLYYSKGKDEKLELSETFKYFIYDKKGKKTEATSVIHYKIQGTPDKTDPKSVNFDFDWDVTLNGKEIAKNHARDNNRGTETERKTFKQLIYEDEYHYYFANYYISGTTAELDVGAAYIEYK